MAATMVPGYEHVPGNHCGSTALRNLLAFGGVELTEEMAFGLGAGACFYYIALDGSSPSRFTNGRTSRLEEEFVALTGSGVRLDRFDGPEESWIAAKGSVDAGRPALLLSDLYYLDHYGKSAHFPGHAVVLAGYDDEVAYLSDTAFDELQTTSLESLAEARHSQYPVYPLAGHMLTLPEPLDAATHHGGCAARHGAGRRAHDRAPAGRLRGPAGPPPLRGRGGGLAAGDRGLAVVRALQLPGDRAPRDGRRQLPPDVLAVPGGGWLGPGVRRR